MISSQLLTNLQIAGLPVEFVSIGWGGAQDEGPNFTYHSNKIGTVRIGWLQQPTVDQENIAAGMISSADLTNRPPPPPAARTLVIETTVGLSETVIADKLISVAGFWIAIWTGGSAAGSFSLQRGGSIFLVGDLDNILATNLSKSGRLTVQRLSGVRDYQLSLSLFVH